MSFKGFIASQLLKPLPDTLIASFDRLDPDVIDYRNNEYRSRYRRFGSFRYENNQFLPAPEFGNLFNQRRDFHLHYTSTAVPALSGDLLGSGLISDLLMEIVDCLPLPDLSACLYGVNQIRVTADDANMGSPAPGLHQDGYSYSCHLGIHRKNVSGGHSIIATSKDPNDVIFERTLRPGEFIFFNDRNLYHTATPVTPRIGGHETYRDMIIIDFISRT